MHDVLEGVAQLELKLMIKHCIDQKYLALNDYNRQVMAFNYGTSESDRPSVIVTRLVLNSDDKKFHLSSSQTLLLCRMLPLIIGDCVPEQDTKWKCFILLRKIIDILVSPVIHIEQCAVLKSLIQEHHLLFKDLHGESLITPKFHFMVHYPEQILAIGPMVRSWTMRCEGKLSLFKRASRLGNFKNIALSLAQRHQRWMCYQGSSGNLLEAAFECSPRGDSESLGDKNGTLIQSFLNVLPSMSLETTIFNATWAKKDGIRYCTNNSYVITGSDGTDPIFGRIVDLYVACENVVFLYCQQCNTDYFDDHFYSYVITESHVKFIVAVENLLSPFVLHGHKLFDNTSETYVTPKYYYYTV